MRIMKRISMTFVLIVAFTLSVAFLTGCGDESDEDKNDGYIRILNESFNAEIKLAQDVPDWETYSSLGFYRTETEKPYDPYSFDSTPKQIKLHSNDGLTMYDTGNFPDPASRRRIVSFTTEDSKYEIFGFSVGGSISEAESILVDNGYTPLDSTYAAIWAYLGKITFIIHGDDTITKITIQLEHSNLL